MFQHPKENTRLQRVRHQKTRRGLSLVELLVAISIMSIVALALGALATTANTASELAFESGVAMQHGRVVVARIEKAIRECYANEEFPGCMVISELANGYTFADTLLVWSPISGIPVNPSGLPQWNEMLIFCPADGYPSQLVEIRPEDSTLVPLQDDATSWSTETANQKMGYWSPKTLTKLVHAGSVGSNSRGAVRFQVRHTPSVAEWSQFRAGTRSWSNIGWAQDIRGSETGLRQTWCQFDLLLAPDETSAAAGNGSPLTPFYGSAARYHQLSQ